MGTGFVYVETGPSQFEGEATAARGGPAYEWVAKQIKQLIDERPEKVQDRGADLRRQPESRRERLLGHRQGESGGQAVGGPPTCNEVTLERMK